MSDWDEVTIGDILERSGGSIKTGPFGTALKASEYASAGVPLISVGEVGYGRFSIHSKTPRIGKDTIARLPDYVLQQGDIVFGRKGAVDRSAVVGPNEAGWFLGSDGIRLRLPASCDARFIGYWLQSQAIRDWLLQHAGGTTMASLNQGTISRIPVRLPRSLAEQKAIASILNALDDKIELNRRMNKTLEAIARAIFKDWFVAFGPTRAKLEGRAPYLAADIWPLFPDRLDDDGKPEGWMHDALLNHARLISGGTPKTDVADYWGGEIAWASAKDVSQCADSFLIGTERTITIRGLSESSTRLIPKHSTVVVARGATTGRFCMFGREMAMNQTCYALASKSFHDFWLNCTFSSVVELLVHAAHGSVFDTITTKTIEGARAIIPGNGLIDRFELLVTPLFKRMLGNIEESRTLADIRDLLLPKLVTGEIRVNDAEINASEVT